ncbi:MAG: polysaccharide pyruvyl transferase family protein, partial [Deltaproteobacteria bacterium]|nr:polysaccharide pyruvyl transferase family protein [Deltaproteobacteria bacterium]
LQEWKDVLQKCRNVSVRGVQSQRLLQSLGISCEVTGDPAIHFACKDNVVLPRKKILGLNWGFAYKLLWGNDEMAVGQVLRDTANRLMSQGWNIKVFSIFVKDTVYCRDWINSLDQPGNVELCVEYKNPRRFIQLVQQCDVFVGMKLHATILAFIAQVPSIMLEYRPKCADFMETMGALSRNIRCDRLDSTDLIALIEQTYLDQEAIRQEQKEISNHYAEKSLKYFEQIQAGIGM